MSLMCLPQRFLPFATSVALISAAVLAAPAQAAIDQGNSGDSQNITMVKRGLLSNFDENVRLGDALSNYKGCASGT